MLSQIRKTIKRYGMIDPGDVVIVAHSGGADSTCLIDSMKRLEDELEIRFASAHFNHGIRGDSANRDAGFVKKMADKLSIPFFCAEGDVRALAEKEGLSLEDAARRARYNFFETLPSQFEDVPVHKVKIALGHTADDQAETVLMRLLRGSGPKGLAGIPPIRGKYIRPLIEIRRDRIVEYLQSRGLEWVEDETNRSTEFLRNRIRHELMPVLIRDYNPKIVDTLSRTARAMSETADLLSLQAAELLKECKIEKDEALIPRKLLNETHPAMALSLIGAAISGVKGDLLEVRSEHRRAVLDGTAADGNSQVTLPGGYIVDIGSENVRIGRQEESIGKICASLVIPGITYNEDLGSVFETTLMELPSPGSGQSHVSDDPAIVHLDFDKMDEPFEVRNLREGDRFQPLGMDGSRKLQDLLVDLKIPRQKRAKVPIITAGGMIAWVAPYRIDNRFRITPETKRVLKISMRAMHAIDSGLPD